MVMMMRINYQGGLEAAFCNAVSSNGLDSMAKQDDITCYLLHPLPNGLCRQDVYVNVLKELDWQTRMACNYPPTKRQETEHLAKATVESLQKQLETSVYTCRLDQKDEAAALAVLEIKLVSIYPGRSKWDRFKKNSNGHVRLVLTFVLKDAKRGHILKHGRIAYVDNLKGTTIRQRCESGKIVLEKLVPKAITRLVESIGI
jgi:hypothetical protein